MDAGVVEAGGACAAATSPDDRITPAENRSKCFQDVCVDMNPPNEEIDRLRLREPHPDTRLMRPDSLRIDLDSNKVAVTSTSVYGRLVTIACHLPPCLEEIVDLQLVRQRKHKD